MPDYIRKQIGERLIAEGLITVQQYELGMQKHIQTAIPLRQVLIDMGFITEEQLMEFMGNSIGIPFLRDIVTKVLGPSVIDILPEKICRQYTAMPLFKTEEVLTIAMADPLDVFAIDDIQNIARYEYQHKVGKGSGNPHLPARCSPNCFAGLSLIVITSLSARATRHPLL